MKYYPQVLTADTIQAWTGIPYVYPLNGMDASNIIIALLDGHNYRVLHFVTDGVVVVYDSEQ